MSVIRVNKTKNYTVMSNYHLKEKEMSLKAKGLLSLMLSLPDDWDYSKNGLVSICKENKTAIETALAELKQFGYLKITRAKKSKMGRFEYIYDIFEIPGVVLPCTENPYTENPCMENQPQLNTKKINTKKLNTKELNTKYIYGEFSHVKLTDEELDKLKEAYGTSKTEDYITRLDEYLEQNHKKHYDSHYLTIRTWIRKDESKPTKKSNDGFWKAIAEVEKGEIND